MVGQQILALPVGVRVPAPQYKFRVGQDGIQSCPTFLPDNLACVAAVPFTFGN